ncbi:MAG TPA: sulfite reductase [Cyanobacteria bacterium UBA11149]|nr:sulfite reductase [Cyanobacteria bacterium UBA11367]HBE59453.1 sulfite reductase [Cyanobacteria bacterium UBA11366]HBK65438.1 sulfite reductase [Cyanobacteria bacterium UBA11166]HBR77205.1 sulfite reductase [Cyanobacteria bacterium UBA11159]HBS72605.1 sulfite reductase [Cyanobacteria bacterium UBA11153]HBW88652.1 sulfite reductase [Cyanobacteria bacterium UBA11149]
MTTEHPLTWKAILADKIPPHWAEEIDTFENQMKLRTQGKLDEKVFAELRLRRGAYGQRYDNGFRYDGEKSQTISFPHPDLTKGPETKWEAPGMQRIKIPYGGMTAQQMEVLADMADEYSDGILHVTTRQDFQLHFISIEDTPDMHRRLAAVGITTREACGNSVRNVTACPLAGVCHDEAFDVTGYANETAFYFFGHPDVQDFGRKFKVAFSGCKTNPCGLTFMHDLGLIATTKVVDGVEKKGFEMYVGGGLGAVPHLAKLVDEFVPVEELLPMSQAIARVYARLGEKKNRNKARIKFLVSKLGIEEFRRLVKEEREILKNDPKWDDWLPNLSRYEESGLPAPVSAGQNIDLGADAAAFAQWKSTNIYQQRQPGFVCVTIALPLGDMTAPQMRGLADIARRFTNDTTRTTVEQNIILRWIHEADLPALYLALKAINLHAGGANSIVDITSCPGTDTCKLGISSSRGLASELSNRLAAKGLQYDEALKNLRIKVSGCFNSCGQQMVAEIGFYGSSRLVERHRVPHFHLILGGEWDNNAAQYGQSLGVFPSKRIPEIVDFLVEMYLKEHEKGEKFSQYVNRIGKKAIKDRLQPFTQIPSYSVDKSFYTDWGDAREYTIGDIGIGECAGEVVSLTDFGVATAESMYFDATLLLEGNTGNGNIKQAADKALEAMLSAAQALLKVQNIDISSNPEEIVTEFRKYFYDTELFFDPFAKGKFASYLFNAYEHRDDAANLDRSRQLIEEARLFIEAAHECNTRMVQSGIVSPGSFKKWLMEREMQLTGK